MNHYGFMASREPDPEPATVQGNGSRTHAKYMYYVYVLLSYKDRKLYIGYSTNLRDRLKRHTYGETASTKHRRPLKLIFYEAYLRKEDALRRERYFKTNKGKVTLKQMLKSYFTELGFR